MIRACAGVEGVEEAEAEAGEEGAMAQKVLQHYPCSTLRRPLLKPTGLKLRGARTVTRRRAGNLPTKTISFIL